MRILFEIGGDVQINREIQRVGAHAETTRRDTIKILQRYLLTGEVAP